MTTGRLDKTRLGLRGHTSVLQWIGLFYRQPEYVQEYLQDLPFGRRASVLFRIYFQIFLCLLTARILSALFFSSAFGLPEQGFWILQVVALGAGIVAVFAISNYSICCLFFAFAVGIARSHGNFSLLLSGILALRGKVSWSIAIVVSLGSGLLMVVLNPSGDFLNIAAWFTSGLAVGLLILGAEGLAIGLVSGLLVGIYAYPRSGLVASMVIGGIYTIGLLRFHYLPFQGFWVWPSARADFYRYHPVAWDERCLFPFLGFDRLLVSYAEKYPLVGEREIDRLIDEYPSQRQAALRARAILVARRAAATEDIAKLEDLLAGLPEGKKGFLKDAPDLRHRVHEIASLQARLDTLDRPFLREPFSTLLVKEIENFEQQIAGFKPPLSTEFRKAARQWLVIAKRQLASARSAVAREPTRQVFRAGDPVDRDREAFVARGAILGELERQVMLATGCPGLLVYGRRRMGKSTLLRNLEGFLPPRVQIVSLSMQQAGAFTSLPDLVGLIAKRVAAVIPDTSEPPTDLKSFERFLESTQKRLEADDRRLLLAIDEYENLDEKIGEGVLSEDLLAVLRESIQTHRRIIWTFAGSHGIDELTHAPWTSYLVSARTIEVTPFEAAETRLLLTEPLKHSPLWRAIDAKRPRFEPGFWGEGGIERIHTEAGGWPHLVQLMAETIVDLVNDSSGASVDSALLERALSKAVVRGNNVFLELLERESRLPGEWDYLRAFRSTDEQPVPADEALDRSLRRRRLVVEEGGRYRLRVPLMARWLRERI